MKHEPIADNLLFCSELVGLKVYDTRRRKIGRVRDAALVPLVDATRVDRFLVGGGWAWLTVRHDQVRSISLNGIYLKDEQLVPYHSDEYMLRLVRDLLDQQIIDSSGRKVVRVTDITFEVQPTEVGDVLRVQEVDVGMRSVLRRLMQGAPAKFVRKLQGPIPPHSIPWEYCNIIEPDPQRRLRLNISNEALEKMHPADLADIVEELGPDDREAIIETIDTEVAAETLSEMDPDVQASILESLEAERAAEILEEMAPDEAAHLLAELEETTSSEILEEMEEEKATEVEELIDYKDNTAGAMMTTEYIALHPDETIGDAMAAMREREDMIESLNTLLLVDDDGKLVSMVPIAKLFLASGETKLQQLASEHWVSVRTDEKQARVTEVVDKYNLLTLPVVDEAGRLEGVITADDIIAALRQK
ncbi:MAG TPA: CBS domain-containing protein [Bryobacteraceae bacterium]|jgi:CBS domain-containing protein|nr:CBS domain-containing protein [Bryobacteraceae bacterium]